MILQEAELCDKTISVGLLRMNTAKLYAFDLLFRSDAEFLKKRNYPMLFYGFSIIPLNKRRKNTSAKKMFISNLHLFSFEKSYIGCRLSCPEYENFKVRLSSCFFSALPLLWTLEMQEAFFSFFVFSLLLFDKTWYFRHHVFGQVESMCEKHSKDIWIKSCDCSLINDVT